MSNEQTPFSTEPSLSLGGVGGSDPPVHVVLLGLMGTGKTVVAEAVAAHLALPFTDNDRAITEATGMTARELLDAHGVRALHTLESGHLLDAVGEARSNMISAAASVIDDEDCRRGLQLPGVLPIWLRATAETLADRFHNEDHRPMFGESPLAFFRDQIAVRSPLFSDASKAVVDVDGRTVPEVVARVIAAADDLLAVTRRRSE
jgi:shikimate kinase